MTDRDRLKLTVDADPEPTVADGTASDASDQAPVLAAGALCWKLIDGKVKVLAVRRARHADVSLPKGKLERGESLPECAIREIAEETGLNVVLGAPLSTVEYRLPNGRPKLVYYWLAEVDQIAIANSTFTTNDEIESLEWLSLKKARASLSYQHDVQLIDEFAARLDSGRHQTFALIALRHAKTIPRERWDGPDATRPLLQQGLDQAASVAHGVAAFRPRRIISSTAVRCAMTVGPTARITGIDPKLDHRISQDAWERGDSHVERVVAKRLAAQQSTLLCSHGPVLPAIVEAIGRQTGTPISRELLETAALAPGEFSVFHVSIERPEDGLVAVETHSPTV